MLGLPQLADIKILSVTQTHNAISQNLCVASDEKQVCDLGISHCSTYVIFQQGS